MSLWGKTDANTAAPNIVVDAGSGVLGPAAFGNTTTVGVFGVSTEESVAARAAGKGSIPPGWTVRTVVGSRIRNECLVAFSGAGSTNAIFNDAEDTILPDLTILFTAHPADVEDTSADFTVAAVTAPAGGTLSYQWQVSTDAGENWANTSDAGVVSGSTTATLSISDTTGLDGNQYRCIVSATGALNATSNAATLTEPA